MILKLRDRLICSQAFTIYWMEMIESCHACSLMPSAGIVRTLCLLAFQHLVAVLLLVTSCWWDVVLIFSPLPLCLVWLIFFCELGGLRGGDVIRTLIYISVFDRVPTGAPPDQAFPCWLKHRQIGPKNKISGREGKKHWCVYCFQNYKRTTDLKL